MGQNNAKIPMLDLLYQAGIDPKTGLPTKVMGAEPSILKQNVRRNLRIMDEQDALNRFQWYNLPDGLNANLIERILYYKGQACMFYEKTTNQFYFLPYALEGTIDCYGRFMGIKPIPFGNGTQENDSKKPGFLGLHLEPIYELIPEEDFKPEMLRTKCVLLHDYSKQLSETNIPRRELQEPILEVMAECIPYMRTSLISQTGINGMKVMNEDDYSNVEAASRSVNSAALQGKKWIPIVGQTEFQELTTAGTGDPSIFMLAMQSLNNFRLSQYGLQNEGLFEKQGTILQSESDMNSSNTDLIMLDGLYQRQAFCLLANSLWGLGMWCEKTDTTPMIDDGGMPYEVEPQEEKTEGSEDYE